jgi:hypothetical protein
MPNRSEKPNQEPTYNAMDLAFESSSSVPAGRDSDTAPRQRSMFIANLPYSQQKTCSPLMEKLLEILTNSLG